MRRPSRSPNFKRTPWVWSHGQGRGNCTDPNRTPCDKRQTDENYLPAAATEIEQTKAIWKSLALISYLVQFNRDRHAGEPAQCKPEEESQLDVYEVEDEDAEMAENVDPTEAALGDGEAGDSGITDATCDADTPIDPNHVVTRDMDLSPGRRIAYRAE
eukprot:6724729-Pyramimonas_sp.AAC.1